MKHVANKVAGKLEAAGITAAAIHGNKSQGARTAALANFKAGKVRVLVATDIAARGIDVDNVSHVINYELPNEPETYVHRIGRTARAGSDGDAISFCSAPERNYLRAIENLLKTTIPTDHKHTLHCDASMNATGADAKPAPRVQRGRGRTPSRSNGPRKQSFGQRQRRGRR
jgi:ATP-dependent RNA helicase RhlE